jgi:hypothetical protein
MSANPPLHFRRCHVCGSTHHRRGGALDRCLSCGKPLAPFFFYDDAHAPIYSETGPRPEDGIAAADPQEIRMPVRGQLLAADQAAPQSRRALRGFTAVW